MENRHKLTKRVQIKYFREVERKSGLHLKELAFLFKIVPRSYSDWRRGKFSIPTSVVKTIENRFVIPFPLSKTLSFKRWKITKQIAAHRGGKARFIKYGNFATPEGRIKGGKHAFEILRSRGLIPPEKSFYGPHTYSPELAEFVGILLGDGHIGREQWSISLNDIADKEYAAYVVQLIINLFGFTPSIYDRKKEHVYIIYGGGKQNIAYLKNLGLFVGNKVTLQVDVPNWIKSDKTYVKECLRGLIETDGGIFKHTYKVNGKTYSYTKLCFTNRSVPLLQFVYSALRSYGLTPKLIDRVANKKVWLYNQNEVKQYLEIVGAHNPRMLVNIGG